MAARQVDTCPPHRLMATKGTRTTLAQRALVKWLSHSRVGSAFALGCVVVLKGIPLLSLLVVLHRARRLFRLVRRLNVPFLYAVVRTAGETWAALELAFWLYFRWKKQSLEARRAYQPSVLWKAPGERKRLLLNLLGNIERIHAGNLEERARSESTSSLPAPGEALRGALASKRKRPGLFLHQLDGPHPRAPESELSPMEGSIARLRNAPSVENFLRFQDEPDFLMFPQEEQPGLRSTLLPGKPQAHHGGERVSPMQRSAPSVENLLRCLDEDSASNCTSPHTTSADHAEELRCLKHLELCSWFARRSPVYEICTDVREIRRGNVEEWILSYWFDGAESPDALDEGERLELAELIDEVARWAALPQEPHLWHGRNPNLRCFRLRNDPFPAVHRPLFAYAFTAFVFPAVGHRALAGLGFRVYRAGSTEYWFRPAAPARGWSTGPPARPRAFPGSRLPLVFCHGIGVGPTMCLSFMFRLVRDLGEEHPIFLVDTAAVSMRFCDDVPCAREVAANMADMLEVWGFRQAHFVGHSFGSFLLAWMVRYQRSYVERCTFMDPVCFLLLKVLVEGHALQQVKHETRMDTMEMGIKYFVLTELFVCNFVCRCFFWEESQLDMEDLGGLQALVVLESEDAIVPTHSVQRLVLAERQRRVRKAKTAASPLCTEGLEVLWVEGQPHAGFLVDLEVLRGVCARLAAFHGAGAEGGA